MATGDRVDDMALHFPSQRISSVGDHRIQTGAVPVAPRSVDELRVLPENEISGPVHVVAHLRTEQLKGVHRNVVVDDGPARVPEVEADHGGSAGVATHDVPADPDPVRMAADVDAEAAAVDRVETE